MFSIPLGRAVGERDFQILVHEEIVLMKSSVNPS
jgi:hypothetical protein